MDTRNPFTTFKVAIQTVSEVGEVSYFPRTPLELLEHAINLALLSEPQADVQTICDRAASQSHDVLAYLRENGFEE